MIDYQYIRCLIFDGEAIWRFLAIYTIKLGSLIHATPQRSILQACTESHGDDNSDPDPS